MQKSFRYILFNKPYGILSQFSNESDEITLKQFKLPEKVYAAGRLDKDSEGLLLLTNDGAFIHRMSDPKFNKEKTYWVQVEGSITPNAIFELQNGLAIENYMTKKCKAKILTNMENYPPRDPPVRFRKNIPTSWIEITLTEGKNRQVRKMTAKVGFPTLRLIRKKIAHLSIENISPGQWIELKQEEIESLRTNQ